MSKINTVWVVEMAYMGKVQNSERFSSKDDAIAFYESKLGACRFGLVGWSVSYPKQVNAK